MVNKHLILRTLNSPYVGNANDVTRNSVLSHNDVDNNFLFLKGEDILTATTSGTTVLLHQVNNNTIEFDLQSMITGQDTFTTGSTLIGSTLVFNTNQVLSAYTADLSPLIDNTNFYSTGGTLIGQTIYIDRTDTLSAYTIDMSNFIPSVDYGNIIFVSENGQTGQTRADIIGNINTPINLEWASQIGQSGDTIHVKSGIYNITTTNANGLSVSGVNHYFENNTKVYKNTSGPMFSKTSGTTEANVFGYGSFYGSGSCGYIFENKWMDSNENIQVFEWDICENSSNSCYFGLSNGHTSLKGKRRILSTGGDAISNIPNGNYSLTVDCPRIESTIGAGVKHGDLVSFTGITGNLKVNSNTILGASAGATTSGISVGGHENNGHLINASYINYVNARNNSNIVTINPLDVTINAGRIDRLTFNGRYIKANAHVGFYVHSNGIVDINLVDRCWGAGTGVINATFNGDFDYTSDSVGINLINSLSGNITANYRLQTPKIFPPHTYEFVNDWWFSQGGCSINFLGDWNIQNWWISQASGKINIPSGTVFNIGPVKSGSTPGVIGETFNILDCDVNIGGTIIERCDTSELCDYEQSGHTYSNTLFSISNWYTTSLPNSSTRVVYNGATIIVRGQNSQLITTNVTGGTIGVYSAGLNTNKMNSFQAEKEKRRISVTGTNASYTVNGETFTCTTGTTTSECAGELVALTNASGTVNATASQDIPGSDTYFYIESDIAGTPLTLSYNLATTLSVIIRHNTKEIGDRVGGLIIEDEDIIRDLYN
jgi:hypothetical protein